jgi:hypothetical protein
MVLGVYLFNEIAHRTGLKHLGTAASIGELVNMSRVFLDPHYLSIMPHVSKSYTDAMNPFLKGKIHSLLFSAYAQW